MKNCVISLEYIELNRITIAAFLNNIDFLLGENFYVKMFGDDTVLILQMKIKII